MIFLGVYEACYCGKVSWVNEVKNLQWKVIAEVVSGRDVFVLSYQRDLGSMLKLKSNPQFAHITELSIY